jgi:tetratricopeptide (TPR) repeat protein
MKELLLIGLLLFGNAGEDDQREDYAHYLQATHLIQQERFNEAIPLLDELITNTPDLAHLYFSRSKAMAQLGDAPAALADLEKTIELDAGNVGAYLMLSRMLLMQSVTQHSERVISLLDKVTELEPSNIEAWNMLAYIQMNLGDQEAQFEALKQALSYNESMPTILFQAAETARELGKTEEAEDYYKKASILYERYSSRMQDDPTWQLQLGKVSMNGTRKYDVAVAAFDRVLELLNGSEQMQGLISEAEAGKARTLFFMEDYEPAAELFFKNQNYIFARVPESIPVLLLSYAEAGRVEQALNLLTQLRGGGNEELIQYINRLRATVFSIADRYEEALKIFDNLMKNYGDNVDNYTQFSQIHLDAKNHDEAEKVIDLALEKFPEEQSDLLFVKAVILERMEMREESVKILADLVEIDKENHLALNFLGYTMAEMGKDLVGAKNYLLRALALDPYQGSYLDSLAWVYYKMGDMVNAERYLLEAMKTRYRSAEVREHVGFLYLYKGMEREALAEFELAIEYDLIDVKPIDSLMQQINELREKLGLDK